MAIAVTAGGCTHGSSAEPEREAFPRRSRLWSDSLDTPADLTRWGIRIPAADAASVRHVVAADARGAEVAVTNADGSVELWRQFNASGLRGQRIRLAARAKTRGTLARAALHVGRSSNESGVGSVSESREIASSRWTDLQAVVDVAPDATYVEARLSARRKGEVWFDEVSVERLAPPDPASIGGRGLSRDAGRSLAVLGRVLSYVRYFHPADESASADWEAFSAHAVERVLASRDQPLDEVIDGLLEPIAPRTRLYAEGERPADQPVPAPQERKTWWYHHGLGSGPVYLGFRVGIEEPESAGVVYVPVPARLLAQCRRATATLQARELEGDMSAQLEMRFVRSGRREDNPSTPIGPPGSVTRLAHDLPADLASIGVGLRGSGHGTVAASGLTFQCEGSRSVSLDLETAGKEEVFSKGKPLYEHGVRQCGSGPCLYVRRKDAGPENNWLDISVGSGLRLRMPLVMARREGRTWPAAAVPLALEPTWSVSDRATRLAAVLVTWGTLALFYPYFPEARVDWPGELEPALDAASRARSPAETLSVLARLISRLSDGHARVLHPGAPLTGLVPLALRRIDRTLVVAGGLEPYLRLAPVGSEVLSLDGVAADQAYARMAHEVSAPTEGFRAYIVPWALGLGPSGTLRRLAIRGPDREVRELVVPLLERDQVIDRVRETRPRSGTQVAPGIFYVDLDTLDEATWQPLLNQLSRARAIVFDARGYPSKLAFEIISHLTDTEIASPFFDVPIVGATGVSGYDRSHWTMRPRAPRLRAKAVFLVDGRAASAAETVLQMVRDHELGLLVGKPTAGTNGNVTSFSVPGGFTVRFTGMRVTSLRGVVIHDRGIEPDYVAQPTLAGLRAGRDEVLEEGLRVATALSLGTEPAGRARR